MDRSVQSLHKLPILKFDVSSKENVQKNINGKNFNYTNNIGNSKESCFPKTRIFGDEQKLPHKNIKDSKSKQKRRKSTSLKNIKRTLSIYSNYITKVLHPTIAPKKIKQSKKGRNIVNKNDDINVLFTCKSSKSIKMQRDSNHNLINEIYGFKQSGKCNNISGAINQSCKRHQPRRKDCNLPKKSRQCIPKCSPLKKLNCNLSNLGCGPSYLGDGHYKLLHFPNYDNTDTEVEAINMRREKLDNCQCKTQNQTYKQKDKAVATTASCFSNAYRGGGDDAMATNGHLECKEVCVKEDEMVKDSKFKHTCNQQCQPVFNPNNLHSEAVSLATVTLKYIIFALAIIVWSPCILVLCICWLLSYPLRPRHTYSTSRCRKKFSTKIHVHRASNNKVNSSVQTCENDDCWSILIRGINWTFNSFGMSIGLFKPLLCTRRKCSKYPLARPTLSKKKCGSRCRIMKSDRKKKYTLYYSKSKGWVMKSTHLKHREVSANQCTKKAIRKALSESCWLKSNDDDAKSIKAKIRSRKQCGKYCNLPHSISETGMPSCRHKHRYLYTNNTGLPVHVKSINPECKQSSHTACRYHKSPHCQKHLNYQKQRCMCEFVPPRCKKYPLVTLKNKVCGYCTETKCNIKRIIEAVENEVWGSEPCGDMYIHTLRKRPWFFVYRMCPSFYPFCLTTYKFYENICHFTLLVISASIWCPLLAFCYMCYAVFCRCL